MLRRTRIALFAAAGLLAALSAPAAFAQASSVAESACMAAVNSQYGGREHSLEVVHSEYSEANSLVIVEADGERWRCLASNRGEVADLSLEPGSGSGSRGPKARSSAMAGDAQRNDLFATVCGVLVGGQDYRYRCEVNDVYQGSRKTRTTLQMPDQRIVMEWGRGNEVVLQFEGMNPQRATYSLSEGEMDVFFEDKTYYYFADRKLAEMELRNFRD